MLLVIFLDQILKVWVKTNMELYEYFNLLGFDRARIHFVENPGMAFGQELPFGRYGKLALSLFRIGAVIFLIHYIRQLLKMKVSFGLLLSFGLILAGALGNIIDSAVYGLIFSESSPHSVAQFMPEGGGYADFLHGKVVDMFHFPLLSGRFPEWFPFWANEKYEFFRPIFNLADTAITIGVLNIIFFQRSFFTTEEPNEGAPTNNTEQKIIEKTIDATEDISTSIKNQSIPSDPISSPIEKDPTSNLE